MNGMELGSRVAVHYIGTLDNGRIFHSTTDEQPLVFTLGAGEVFPALEQAVLKMKVGEACTVVIPAEQAYGLRQQENIIRLERSCFPADRELRVGQKLALEFGGRSQRVMLVTEVSDSDVTLDGNHPLAGLDLTFALRLDAVVAGENHD